MSCRSPPPPLAPRPRQWLENRRSLFSSENLRSHLFQNSVRYIYITIIPLGLVGYEMIDSQRGATCLFGYNHLISNKPEWNNCFIKNNHQISLKSCHVLFRNILSWTTKRFSSAAIVSLRGKKFQNFSYCADAYTYHICRAWYNGSYTMASKPIKFLELHYTMTQIFNIYIYI